MTVKNSPTQNSGNLKFSTIFNLNGGLAREKEGHLKNLRDKRTSLKLEDVALAPSNKKTQDFTP